MSFYVILVRGIEKGEKHTEENEIFWLSGRSTFTHYIDQLLIDSDFYVEKVQKEKESIFGIRYYYVYDINSLIKIRDYLIKETSGCYEMCLDYLVNIEKQLKNETNPDNVEILYKKAIKINKAIKIKIESGFVDGDIIDDYYYEPSKLEHINSLMRVSQVILDIDKEIKSNPSPTTKYKYSPDY
jgi:hypothetical protein